MADFVAGSKSGSVLAHSDDTDALRRDVEARREDLVASVAALRRTVSDTLDLQKQAERVILLGRQRAQVALQDVRARVQERPRLFIGVALGVVTLFAVTYAMYRRAQPPRWKRQLDAYRRAFSENVSVRIGRPDVVD